jgi:hypothetical protein
MAEIIVISGQITIRSTKCGFIYTMQKRKERLEEITLIARAGKSLAVQASQDLSDPK